MAQSGYVDARWVAAYRAELPDRTQLIPGETIVSIPKGEAEASDSWEPVTHRKASSRDGGE